MHLPFLLDDLGGPSPAARASAIAELAGASRPLPPFVAVNLARRCRSATCLSCLLLAGSGPRPFGELSTVESLHVAHQVIALHPALLLLSGGDPLDREDLETIAAHAIRRGAGVSIATPGGRLSDRRLDRLQEAGVTSLLLVLPPPSESRPESWHVAALAADARAAVGRARRRGFRVIVQSMLSESSRDAAGELARWCASEGAQALHVELTGTERGILAAERELAVQERRLRRSLVIRTARRTHGDQTCACDSLACRVTADGRLTACPCVPEGLADLRRQPFANAYLDAPSLVARRQARERAANPAPAAESSPQLALSFDAEPGGP